MVDAAGGVPPGDLWLHVRLAGSRGLLPGTSISKVNKDGSFVTGALEEGREYDLAASDNVNSWVARRVLAGAKDVLVRPVSKEWTLAGVVLDEAGKPVPAGVLVTASPLDPSLDWASTQTVSGGTFLMKGLSDSAYRVWGGGLGTSFTWAETRPVARAGAKDLTVQVREGITVQGVLRKADGTPLETSLIVLLTGDTDRGGLPCDTDEGGRFEIKGLPPGEITLKLGSIDPDGEDGPSLGTFRIPCEPLVLKAPPEAAK